MGKFALINRLWVKRNSKGSAIMLVLFVFVFLMITATTVLSIHGNNLRQAKKQEQSMEAYYLAYSGCEIGWEALMAGLKKQIEITDSNPIWGPQTFTIDKDNEISKDYLGGGEINVQIFAKPSKDEDGNIIPNEIDIYINSTGKHKSSGHEETKDLCLEVRWIKDKNLFYKQYLSKLEPLSP